MDEVITDNSKWYYLTEKKPPYYEFVIIWMKEGNNFSVFPYQFACLIPGSVFDEYHPDFWIDDCLGDTFLHHKDIFQWRLFNNEEAHKPRVKFVEKKGVYSFELIWTPNV